MKDWLIRAWRWRLRTKRDYALFTATLVGLGLVNLVILGDFTIARGLTTVAGLITAFWIVTKLLPPKEGP